MQDREAMKESVLIRIQYYGGILCRFVFGFEVSGAERVPRKGGVIIACNHISEMDPPILGFAIPRTVAFMAKVELFGSRFSSYCMNKLNAFPVDRNGLDTEALRTSIDTLRAGNAVVIFPEGTRSRDGRLLPVKAGISLIATAAESPVLPAFIWGTDHPVRAASRRGNPFSVHFGRLIPSSRIRSIRREQGTRAVAGEVMAAIARTGIEAGLYSSSITQ